MSEEKKEFHLVVDEDTKQAVRSVAAEQKREMKALTEEILRKDPKIAAALRRIRSK